jgi:hypothetical protein
MEPIRQYPSDARSKSAADAISAGLRRSLSLIKPSPQSLNFHMMDLIHTNNGEEYLKYKHDVMLSKTVDNLASIFGLPALPGEMDARRDVVKLMTLLQTRCDPYSTGRLSSTGALQHLSISRSVKQSQKGCW